MKFVWQQNARGRWVPSVFSGEMPRDLVNATNIRTHAVSEADYDAAVAAGASVLDALAQRFPSPPPEVEDQS